MQALIKLYVTVFSFYQTLREFFWSGLAFFRLTPKSLPAQIFPKSTNTGILVTGASTGIGRNIALALCERGYTVFAGIRKQKDAQSLQASCNKFSGCLITTHLDVKIEASINDTLMMVENWVSSNPNHRLAAVVNNAGVVECLPMEITPMETIEDIIDTNYLGTIRMSKAFLPLLRESKGRIICMGSIQGDIGIPLMSTYSASKYALEGWCDAVRRELYHQQVQVVLVKPGTIYTPVFAKTKVSANATLKQLESVQFEIANEHYNHLIDGVDAVMKVLVARALDPAYVTISILHAIESPFPQTRYLVGLDALGLSMISKVVPDRILDAGLMVAIKLHEVGYNIVSRFTKAR